MKYLIPLLFLLSLTVFTAGQTAPVNTKYDFVAPALDGSKIDTRDLRGKVVVYNLWFVNCPNCIQEIKLLNLLVADYKDNKDVVFLGLAASRKDQIEGFLKKNSFQYTIVPDAAIIIIGKFGTPDKSGEINVPFPMHFVLDRNGNAVVQAQGIKGVDAVRKELEKQFPTRSQAIK